jgi:cytochrome P450
VFKPILGDGLLVSQGELWQRQRRLARPAFARERLHGSVDQMAEAVERAVDRWLALPAGDIDLHREMTSLTFRIVGLTLLGIDLEEETEEFARAARVCRPIIEEHARLMLRLPLWVPTPTNRRFEREVSNLHRLIRRIITRRRSAGDAGRRADLLSTLMSARDDDASAMDDQQLHDEIVSMLLAGHDTVTSGLTFLFHLLDRHPEIQERLRAELFGALGERRVGPKDIDQLGSISRTIEEAMRLYPPIWAFEREAIADDTLGGFAVPAGTRVGFLPYILHRHPAYWDDPDRFDPDRFLRERAERSRPAYLPFGLGPRTCIGAGYAMVEMVVVAATMLRRCSIRVTGGQTALDPGLTLRPRGGMPARVVAHSPRVAEPTATDDRPEAAHA